jgi:hypothetical protein
VDTILAPSQDTHQRIVVYSVHCAYGHTMGTRTSTTANFCKASLSGTKPMEPIKNMRGSCVNYIFESALLSNLDGSFGRALTTKNIPLDITVADIVQKHKPFYPTVSVSPIISTTGRSSFLAYNNNSESIVLWKEIDFSGSHPLSNTSRPRSRSGCSPCWRCCDC